MNTITKHNNYGIFDPFFDDFFVENKKNQIMKTDIIEKENHYELKIEVPEIKKEDIKLSLENGYLNIKATFNEENESTEEKRYICRERHYGSYSRSFYVGDTVKEEDIKAKLSEGVLTLNINKVLPNREEKKYITIE